MTSFEVLDPNEAKRLEKEAYENFKLKKLSYTKVSPQPIFKVKSVFPFQLFPDELLVFNDRVRLVNNLGSWMNNTRELRLHEIAQVEADVGPIFGHLHIYPKLRTEEPLLIERLTKTQALKAREFVDKLIDKPLENRESTY